jgi:glutamine amidotransferase
MIVIVDYELGNPKLIKNMLKRIGHNAMISKSMKDINNASFLIIPGVGNFKQGMNNLKKLDLINSLNKQVLTNKVPVLGICLGMQLMANFSSEGFLKGLGWIDAEVKKFNFQDKKLKIPHMGWNDVFFNKKNNLVFPDSTPRFYFVHSYFVHCNNPEDILSSTTYGNKFVSGFIKDNIMGVQFHPEKSHNFGIEIFKMFLNSAKS